MAITLRDAPIGGIRLTDTVQPYNSEAFEADNTRGGLINEAIRGWNASGIGSASSALEEQALKAGIEGRRADQAYLQQQAQGLRQRAQMWAPTVSEATDINSLSSGVDWLGGAVGNLRSSVAPAVGGLAGAVTGTALAPFTGGVINPLTGAMIGAGVVGYNTMTDEAIGNAATDKVVQDRLRRGEITEQDILNTSRLSGAVQAPLEALVPAGLGSALAGGVKKEIGKRAAAYIGGQMLKEGGEEALTEGAQSLVGQTGQNYLRGDDLTNYDWKDVANSAAAGFAPGAVMGGTGGAATAAWNKTTEPNADGKNVWERAGDYIADRGTAAGKRQAEKEGESLRARLDAMEKQLTSTPRLDPTMTEADAAATVMQDDQLKRTAAQELSAAVLNDPDASPAKREIMERYVRSSEAGATNAHEALGAELGVYGRMQEKVLNWATNLLGKVGIEPAPDNRGKANAMRPERQPYTDDELYRHSRLYDMSPDLRTLPLSQLAKVDKAIERFAQGEFGPEVRTTLDQMFGAPEITEQVLSLYREGKSDIATQSYGDASTKADRSQIMEDDGGFRQSVVEEESFGDGQREWDGESKVTYAKGLYTRPRDARRATKDPAFTPNTYFDTDDEAQATRLDRAVGAMGKATSSAAVNARKVGMVSAEVERQLGDKATPSEIERLQLKITNEYFPKLTRVIDKPQNFSKLSPEAQKYHIQRHKEYKAELARRVSEIDARYKTVRSEAVSAKAGDLDFGDDDVKELEFHAKSLTKAEADRRKQETIQRAKQKQANGEFVTAKELRGEFDQAEAALNNQKVSPTNGVLILERSNSKTPFFTTAPNLIRKGFKFGEAGKTVDQSSDPEDRLIALSTALTSLIDYSRRAQESSAEFAARQERGEVADYEIAPAADKMGFTGRVGFVVNGKPIWLDPLPAPKAGKRTAKTKDALKQFAAQFKQLPDNFKLAENTEGRLTMGDVRAALEAKRQGNQQGGTRFITEATGDLNENGLPEQQLIVDPKSVEPKRPYAVAKADTHEERVAALKEFLDRWVVDGEIVPAGTVVYKDTNGNVIYKGPQPEKIDQFTFKNAELQRRLKGAKKVVAYLLGDLDRNEYISAAVASGNEGYIQAVYESLAGGYKLSRYEQEMDVEVKKPRYKQIKAGAAFQDLENYGRVLDKQLQTLKGEARAKLFVTRNKIKAIAKEWYRQGKDKAAWNAVKRQVAELYKDLILNSPDARNNFRQYDPYPDNDGGKGVTPIDNLSYTNQTTSEPNETGLLQYGKDSIHRNDDGTTSSNPGYNVTGVAKSPDSRQIKPDERVVDRGVLRQTVETPRMRELRDSKDLPVGAMPVVDDFGNVVMDKEDVFIGRMTRPARPGEMTRQADTVPSRGEDNMSPTFTNRKGEIESVNLTKPLPESERAVEKDDKPDRVEVVAHNIRRGFGGFMDWFKKLTKEQQVGAVSALRLIKNMKLAGLRKAYDKTVDADLHNKIVTLAAKLEASIIEGPFGKDYSDGPFAVNEQGGHYRDSPLDALGARNAPHVRPQKVRDDGGVRDAGGNTTVAEALQRPEAGRVAEGTAATNLTQRLTAARKVEFGEIDEGALGSFLKDYVATAKWVDDTTDLREEKYALREKKTRTEAEERRLDEVEDMLQLSLVRASPNENYADVYRDYVEELQDLGNEHPARSAQIMKILDGLDELARRAVTGDLSVKRLSKPNAQSAQTPKQDKSATKAELDAVVAEISAMVGPDTTVKIFKEINDGQWSGEWSKENGQTLIKIALGAHDKLGVGYHEAMHQLFSLLSQHGGESVKRLLGNVATNQLIMRQLKLKLAEEKAALDQLSDPEEAAAYTFQFWRAEGLKVGPQVDTLFKKIVNALDNLQLAVREKLFGSNKAAARRSEKAQAALAERVMQLYKNGAFADPSLRNDVIAALEKDAKAVMNKRAQVNAVGKAFTSFAKRWVYTAADAFESSGNPVLEALGKRLFHLEGDKTSHQSYLERHAMMADRYSNRVRDIFVGLNEDEVKQLGKYLNERRDPSTVAHPELRARMEQIVGRKQPDGTYKDGLLPEMRLYMMNSGAKRWEPGKDGTPGEWVDMGEVRELYWPRMWDTDKLMANVDEFLTELTADIEAYRAKGGYPEASENYPSREIAKNILNSLVNGQGANDIEETETDFDTLGVQPFMSSINRRELNWIDDKKYAKYFSDDPVFALTNYVAQSTKRAEFVREFGNGGEELAAEVQRAMVWEMGEATIGGDALIEKAEVEFKKALKHYNKLAPDERKDAVKPTIITAAKGILKKQKVENVDQVQLKAAETIKPAVEAIQAIEGTLGHDIDPRWRMVGSAVTTYQNFRLLVPALFSNINDIAGIVARGGEVSDAFNALVRAAREIRLRWKDDYSKDELAQLAENIGVVGAGSFMNGMGQAYSSQFMYGKLRRANDALFKWNGLEAMNRAVRIEATGAAIRSIESNLKNPNKAHSQRHLEEVYGEGFDRENLLDAQGRLDMNNERNREAVMRWVNGAIIRPNASLRPSKASDPNYVLFYHLKQFAYAFQKVHLRRAYLEAKEGNYTPAMSLVAVYMPITIAADVVRESLLPDDDPPWMKQGMGAYLQHGVARANFGGVPQMYLEGVTDPAKIFGPLVNQVQDMASVPLFEDKELDRELLGALPGGTLARRLDRD